MLNNFEKLIADNEGTGIRIFEKKLKSSSWGLTNVNVICIDEDLDTTTKHCVLAEKLEHYYTTTGEIYRQDTINTYQRRSLKGRIWAYERPVPFSELMDIVKTGYECVYEIADFLM